MSHTTGGRRSPDGRSSPHDRARARLAERMTDPLEAEESVWLEAHLMDCPACRGVDTAYKSQRASLRAMRAVPPPRDLWARTSAALDAEQARAGRGMRSRPARQRSSSTIVPFPRGRWAPIGALGSIAAVMLVGFIVGNALIGGSPAGSPSAVALGATSTPNLLPTPIPVPGADVAWVSTDTDGSIVVRQASVSDVCPTDDPAGCAPLDRNASNVVTLSVKPKSVHQSPTSGQMIVFGTNVAAGKGLSVYVIETGGGAAPTPVVPPTTVPTASPSGSVGSTPPSTGGPSQGPVTSPTASTTGATSSPSASLMTTPQPTATATPAPTSTASIVPNVTPTPTAAHLIGIASNASVLSAETAAYSPDGTWFAFTARPSDPSVQSGSDIYLWHAGDKEAKRVTTDGRSVFAGWASGRLVGSRAAAPVQADAAQSGASASPVDPAAPAAPAEYSAVSFLLDPAALTRTTLPTAAWRPAIDPTGRFVVYWEGTVALDPTTGMWHSATGRLVLRAWPIAASGGSTPSGAQATPSAAAPSAASTEPSASASAGSSAVPSASTQGSGKPDASLTASPSASLAPSISSSPSVPAAPTPVPTATPAAGLPITIGSASGVDWTVAWDETGTHLALWIGDGADPSLGRLTLLAIGANGQPSTGGALIADRPALPGFSLSAGHLAWATPPGVDGNGSTLTIYAYSGKDPGMSSGVGQSGPDRVIVVQH